jgi:hypothetical protein
MKVLCGGAAGLVLAALVGGLAGGQAMAATASAQQSIKFQNAGPGKPVETINLSALGAQAAREAAAAPKSSAGPNEARQRPFRTFRPQRPYSEAQARALAPAATAVSTIVDESTLHHPAFSGSAFNGIDHNDQRIIADGGNQFSLEPPDQALAVGAGFVVESVNNAIQVFDRNGHALLSAPVSMNRFFNQPSEYNRVNGQFGPFLSDPRAYFDAETRHFIVSEWGTLNDASGNPLNISVQWVAVSATSDPTQGWNIYSYETTNSQFFGCPCLPDFDQLGMDAHGIYVSNNLFSLIDGSFVGAILYALPKKAMEAGSLPYVLQTAPIPFDFSIHPTVTPPGAMFANENGGSEYLVENLDDLTDTGASNLVNVWSITGTRTLRGTSPNLFLNEATVKALKVSAVLPPAVQKDGPRPLGNSLGDPAPYLNPDDGRFSATPVYVNGTITATSSTAVLNPDSSVSSGVAFYQFGVAGDGAGGFTVGVTKKAIISAPHGNQLLYPAVGMTPAGVGVIGVTLVGPNWFPATASINVPEFVQPRIVVQAHGGQADDGFTAYAQYGGNGVGRWGDYGAASVDGTGTVWIANEYVPDDAIYPRSSLANWGTFITPLKP